MSTVDSTSSTPDDQAEPRRPRAPRAPRPSRRPATLDTTRPAATEAQRTGEICPTCFTTKALTGTCDTCE